VQKIVLERVDIEMTGGGGLKKSEIRKERWSSVQYLFREAFLEQRPPMVQSTAVAFRAGLNACQAQQAHFDSRIKASARDSKWGTVTGKARCTEDRGQ
jgi:hypothetical protein